MDRKRVIRSNIVPGRRPITEIAALHEVGIAQNMSYMNEKSLLDESSQVNDTVDVDEREWKRQGFTENQIQRLYEDRKQKQLKDARDRLHKEKYGAKGFDEMLQLPQYSSGRESEDDDEYHDENTNNIEIQVFAIPALPKHLSEKSIMGSPVAGSKGSGKAGLSCSTPKSGNDVSMRSLRSLDISHVVSTDKLNPTRTTTHTKNIMLPILESREKPSMQNTHTIRKDVSSELEGTCIVAKDDEVGGTRVESISQNKEISSLQKTHTIRKDASSELQGTFTVANDVEGAGSKSESVSKNSEDSTLQKTFTVAETSVNKTFVVAEADKNDPESSLQGTFVLSKDWSDCLISTQDKHGAELSKKKVDNVQLVDSPGTSQQTMSNVVVQVNPSIVEVSMQGGEKGRFNGVGAQKREKRGANMSNSLMASMIEDIPSPGANYFKNPRKKLRNTAKSPSKAKAINRLSTDSDKEKTIDMLSIAEEASIDTESVSSSYVDPVSINGTTQVSPIPEIDEPMDVATTTPKSSNSRTAFSIRRGLMEKARSEILCATPPAPTENNTSSLVSPKLHYQKPTLSSMLKNKGGLNSDVLLSATPRGKRAAVNNEIEVSQRPILNFDTSANLDHQETNDQTEPVEERAYNTNETRNSTFDVVNEPPNDIDLPIGEMTIQSNSNQHVNNNLDMDYDDDIEPNQGLEENESNASRGGPSRGRRHRVGLLSDSIATVNTPGIDCRPTRHLPRNEEISDDSSVDDESEEVGRRRNSGRHSREVGLLLKKREIIQPDDTSDGVRRSQRTRVKPVRSWLGEQPVYVNSPSGGKRLTGVTDVIIKDKRLCRYKTADLRVATEREQKAKARRAAIKREQLARDHQRGRRLDVSQDDIHTDEE